MTRTAFKSPIVLLMLCILTLAFSSGIASAQQKQEAPQTEKTATTPPIPLSPIANQLGQTLQSLVAGTTTATPSEQAPDQQAEENAVQITYTFATDLLNTMAKAFNKIQESSVSLSANVTALPSFMEWVSRQRQDPRRVLLWESLGSGLTIIILTPLLFAMAASLLLWPIKSRLLKKKISSSPEKAGVALGMFWLRLSPVLVFLGSSLLLLDQNENQKLQRFIILNILYAVSLVALLQTLLLSLLSPSHQQVRLLQITNTRAVSAYKWLTGFSTIIIGSYFFMDVASALRIPADSILAFQNVVAAVLSIMATIVIFKTRAEVASILRGRTEDTEKSESYSIAVREWLARHWHTLATIYLAAGFAITVMDIHHGLALMLRGTILSLLIMISARTLLAIMEKWRQPLSDGSTRIHRQAFALIMRPFIWAASMTGIAATWGADVSEWFSTQSGQRMLGAFLPIAIVLCVVTAIYETIDSLIDRHLNRKDSRGKPLASARTRSLLPMVRMSSFVFFSAVAFLVALSAIGIDIAPLLAGAGVIGVAIGFGSQSLVKDFLTGLFIVMENSVTVGDVIKIDSFQGVVENMTIRTMSLRDVDGALHILPFSEVTRITNLSRGFSYALVDIGVAYDSDLDHVTKVLQDVGASMQEDPIYRRIILEPLEVMGVEVLGNSSITVRARIRTRPGRQGEVRRMLLLNIKKRFDKEGIEIPFPIVTHITKKVP